MNETKVAGHLVSDAATKPSRAHLQYTIVDVLKQ